MWTVHEDEYKNSELDSTDAVDHGSTFVEELVSRPIGVYTKSSQVFFPPALAPREDVTIGGAGNSAARFPLQQPPISAASASNLYSRPQVVGTSAMRVDAPPFEPFPDTVAAAISYAASQPLGPHGGTPTPMSHMSHSEHRSPQLSVPMEDGKMREKERGAAPYVEWGGHPNGVYHPHVAVRPYSNVANGVSAECLRGAVYETAKDQHGCRHLQRLLGDSDGNSEVARVIMNEIVPHVAELMTDQYANFLVQKLFDIMPPDVRYKVAYVAAPKIADIALTPHGTFSVQKMIETISTREEMEIIREALSRDVVRLVKDANGNHAIQKVLQRFDHEDKEFIYAAVGADCVPIAKNKQGCCVLQRCLEYASPTQRSTLVKHILDCCLQIAEDPYGNYVLQYVLQSGNNTTIDTIAIAFLPHLVQLCMNKFSSNVMEKVLCRVSPLVREMYVETMCTPEVAARLIQDDFGNYVLQTALTRSTPAQAEALVAVLRPLMPTIRSTPYAKKLEAKIDSILHKTVGGRAGSSDCDGARSTEGHEAQFEVSRHDRHHGQDVRTPRRRQVSS
ncbi:putative Pumilio family RNA binding repeat [Trypanosoma vivax]|nr:putative Pumilio family RNA binding repeat [Trypanosoma vivax]